MKLLVLLLSIIVLCFAEELEVESKKTVKRGVLGYPSYASGFGYGHYAPVVSTYVAPVVSKVSYGYKPYASYYGGYYGHGHGLYGHGYGFGHGYGGYGLGHGYGDYYYPSHGYYGLGHGLYGLGNAYYGLGHGYYGLGHGHHGWW